MQSIFTEAIESPVAILRQSMSVSLNDDGIAVVSFAVNRGKGSGAQVMPVAEFKEYVTTLEGIVESGIPEATEENFSAAETVRRTIHQEDGIVSFRVRSGKGAKPAKLPVDSFAEVVELLRGTVEAVEAASTTLAK